MISKVFLNKVQSSYILRRPKNIAKSSPYFWLVLHRTKVKGRFHKILWPAQNIWTLTTPFFSESVKTIFETKFHFWRRNLFLYFLSSPYKFYKLHGHLSQLFLNRVLKLFSSQTWRHFLSHGFQIHHCVQVSFRQGCVRGCSHTWTKTLSGSVCLSTIQWSFFFVVTDVVVVPIYLLNLKSYRGCYRLVAHFKKPLL